MRKLKATYLKLKSKLIISFSIVMIAIALVNIYYVLEVRVTSNDECLWVPKKVSPDSAAIYFDVVKVKGVTWNAGIRNGDQLLKINDVPLKSTSQAQMILNQISGGNYAEYVFKKPDGKIVESKVYIKKLIQFGSLASSLSALFWFLIGFIVLMAKPEGKPHKLFFAIGIFAVFATMEVIIPKDYRIFDYIQSNRELMLLLLIFWSIGISFIGPAILYFFWIFPSPFKFAENKWVKRLLLTFSILLSFLIIAMSILTFAYMKLPTIIFISTINIVEIFLSVVNVVAIISLIVQYRRIQAKEGKKPILLIIIALTFGLAISIYTSQIAPAISDLSIFKIYALSISNSSRLISISSLLT